MEKIFEDMCILIDDFYADVDKLVQKYKKEE